MTKTTKKTNSHQGDNGHTLFKYTGRVQLIGHSGRQSRTRQTITPGKIHQGHAGNYRIKLRETVVILNVSVLVDMLAAVVTMVTAKAV